MRDGGGGSFFFSSQKCVGSVNHVVGTVRSVVVHGFCDEPGGALGPGQAKPPHHGVHSALTTVWCGPRSAK